MSKLAFFVAVFVIGMVGLLGLSAFLNYASAPEEEVCATEADAGRQWASTGKVRKNEAGQYLCQKMPPQSK
jgi:hypothetical protein